MRRTPPLLPIRRKPVTVCIAAVCDAYNETKLILCTDTKSSGALGTKTALKDRVIHPHWTCLTSGGESDINAVVQQLRHHLFTNKKIDETNIIPIIEQSFQDIKINKCDQYTIGSYAIKYDAFLKNGKTWLPEDVFRNELAFISRISLNIEIIIAGFPDGGGHPMLIKLDGNGKTSLYEDFLTAGEGAYLAEASLMHRQLSEGSGLGHALYCVFEAKTHAQRVPSVGEATLINLMPRSGAIEYVEFEGIKYLIQQYEKYGPQKISEPIDIQSSFIRKSPVSFS
jgi:20S proteasome alpha/beta subunit